MAVPLPHCIIETAEDSKEINDLSSITYKAAMASHPCYILLLKRTDNTKRIIVTAKPLASNDGTIHVTESSWT